MVKKMKSSSSKSSTARGDLAASVKESAQQIWLAGMGAFAKAQEEGTKVFSELVKEGKSLQSRTQGLAEDKLSEVTGRMSAMADSVQNKAGQNWDKLEGIFEQRTAKAMGKLGVPTAREMDALARRVDAIEAQLASQSKAPVAKAVRAKATRSKAKAATAEPAAVKKTVARAGSKRVRKSSTAGKSA